MLASLVSGAECRVASLAEELNMKKMIFVSLAFVFVMAVGLRAQDATSQDSAKSGAQEHKSTSHTKTVTGCLQKGDEADEFSITGKDGKTWGLRSSTVKLDQHVGHEVTVSGSAHRESEAEEKKEKAEHKEGQMEKAAGKEEYGDIKVTDLKMMSETCSK